MLEAFHSKTAFFKPALYYLNTENPRGATTLENSNPGKFKINNIVQNIEKVRNQAKLDQTEKL